MSTAEEFGAGLTGEALDELCVNTIRTLAIDAVQKADSGHPGLPMGCADAAYVLWTQFLKVDPADPAWPDRDRFVLSAGHGSMLLYALLHLTGYDLTMRDIENFRQLISRAPGHPEFGLTPGVEATTGPLGQGTGNAVGMAIAEAWLGATFNSDAHRPVDHFTYVVASDGDLMEGVTAEACSLAGHLGLGKIVVFYDSNRITIEGDTDLAYSDDVRLRFEGYHWHVVEVDGHDREAIAGAFEAGRAETGKPTLIIGATTIAKGSPNKAGTAATHGAPLGKDEVRATKKNLGWPEEESFLVPEAARARFGEVAERGKTAHEDWTARFEAFRAAEPDKAAQWDAFHAGEPPEDLEAALPSFEGEKTMATRKSAGKTLTAFMERVGNLIGGSADLAPSTNTLNPQYGSFSRANRAGRNLHFGVREHAMGAILNGLCYHGGVRPFGATFLIFSDYMRPAIRLAAMSKLNPIYVFTHDSIFLGEDGPTHQPIEHFAALRTIPNLTVIRPADAAESAQAWLAAIRNQKGPTALCLTRQNVPVLDRTELAPAEEAMRGGYILAEGDDLTIIATGSEVQIAIRIRKKIAEEDDLSARVVSLPSWEMFERQSARYRRKVLGDNPRIVIEAGVRQGWERYLGPGGMFVGIDHYGASAPWLKLALELGFDAGEIVERRLRPWWKAIETLKDDPATTQ